MNNKGVLTTKKEVKSFNGFDYQFPTKDVTFIGSLDSRSWGKKFCLVCNFTADDGRKYKLIAYGRRGTNGNVYGPKDCIYNFADASMEGQKFICTIKINSEGRHVWVSAE